MFSRDNTKNEIHHRLFTVLYVAIWNCINSVFLLCYSGPPFLLYHYFRWRSMGRQCPGFRFGRVQYRAGLLLSRLMRASAFKPSWSSETCAWLIHNACFLWHTKALQDFEASSKPLTTRQLDQHHVSIQLTIPTSWKMWNLDQPKAGQDLAREALVCGHGGR